jgi:membrane-bound lytic murein transglycosylase D
MKQIIIICLLLQSTLLWGQYDTVLTNTTKGTDTLLIRLDDPIAKMLDSTFLAYYFDNDDFITDTALLNIYHYSTNEIPLPEDSIIIDRLRVMSENSPIPFSAHRQTIAYAKLYAQKKRRLTARMLGASALYFPVFEEIIAKYQLPEELKYLPIIESALNAKARSHMGASGLWQFMPRTAEGRGLEVSSYIDERSDLYKSTDAACRYLRDAYEIYEDWQLALASYNCGAGNVNKAIRRSNGATNFWEVKEFLPKETQNYVPAFLGCAYAMTYHKEHNIFPVQPRAKFFEIDTIHVCERVNFKVLETYLKITTEDLTFFNPSYLQGVIPNRDEDRVLMLPRMKIGIFIQNEDSIYEKSKRKSSLPSTTPVNRVLTYHTVKSGDYLGKIAEKYHCSVTDLKKWNYLRSDKLRTGKKLRVYKKTPKGSSSGSSHTSSTKKPVEKEVPKTPGSYYYYTIKKGDTLWHIAQRYNGVTTEDLKRSNSSLNFNNLKTGTKIKIPK